MGPDYADEIDCSSFFDHIDDLIEFPLDNDCGDVRDCKNFPDMWNDVVPENDYPLFDGSHLHSASDLSAELSVPHEDIVQLEWLSTFMEDSFSGEGLTIGKDSLLYMNKVSSTDFQFKSSSPVSELESSSSSSSSCSGRDGKTVPHSPTHRGPQRARSKRPRPATFNPRPVIRLISPSTSTVEAPHVPHMLSSESDNFVESLSMKKLPKPSTKPPGEERKKKKKIKITLPSGDSHAVAAAISNPPPVRKCLHCEITNTPQWRAGPLGLKTLCNACGVRYKSGRLFPEYRPAASPTFVPSLHSNSHKKVVEMRAKVAPGTPPPAMPTGGPKPSLAS